MNEFYGAPKVVNEYDSSRYGGPGGRRSFDIQWRLLEQLLGPLDRRSRVVEVGPGTGAFTAKIRALGAPVTAFDASRTMLQHAMSLGRVDRPVQGFADALPFPNDAFDLAVTVNCLNHVENAAGAVAEMLRVAPRAIVAAPNRRSLAIIGRALKALLRRDRSRALAFTSNYRDVRPPFSRHLEIEEVRGWVEAAGGRITAWQTSHLLPLIPGVLVPASGVLEWVQRVLFPTKGTFLVIVAERRSSAPAR